MTKKKNSGGELVAPGVQNPGEEKKLAPIRHGLYRRPDMVKLDGRSHLARMRRQLKESFLSDFDAPSPRIQAMAWGAATNYLILESFRDLFLKGEAVAPSVWKDYCGLSNLLRRDLCTLETLAQEGKEGAKAPALAEYLEAIRSGRLVVGAPGEESDGG